MTDTKASLAKMVELDEQIDAEHPGFMCGDVQGANTGTHNLIERFRASDHMSRQSYRSRAMRSDFHGLPYAAKQAIRRGEAAERKLTQSDASTPDLISLPREVVEQVREALAFYGDPNAWNERPVETVNHEIFGKAYMNRPAEIRKDRGTVARQALALLASIGE